MNKPLYFIVAFLASAVVGCDDPEVQDKVGAAIQYGAVIARIECDTTTSIISPPMGPPDSYQPAVRNIRFSMSLMADGSCFVGFNGWLFYNLPEISTYKFLGASEEKCQFPFLVLDNPLGYGPSYDPVTDHSKYTYSSSDFHVHYCDYGNGGCTEAPTPSSSECTGFNLSAFE